MDFLSCSMKASQSTAVLLAICCVPPSAPRLSTISGGGSWRGHHSLHPPIVLNIERLLKPESRYRVRFRVRFRDETITGSLGVSVPRRENRESLVVRLAFNCKQMDSTQQKRKSRNFPYKNSRISLLVNCMCAVSIVFGMFWGENVVCETARRKAKGAFISCYF